MWLQPDDVAELVDLLARLLRHPNTPRLPVRADTVAALRVAAVLNPETWRRNALAGWAASALVSAQPAAALAADDLARIRARMDAKAARAAARRTDPATSHEAAELAEPSAKANRWRVRQLLFEAWPGGLTADEMVQPFNARWPVNITGEKVNARVSDLRYDGWVVTGPDRRPTIRNGTAAVHYLSPEGYRRMVEGDVP